MKNTLLLITTLLFVISCGTKSEPQKVQLNLVNGNTYKMAQTSNMDIHQEVNGQKIDMDMKMVGIMSFEVADVQDDTYTLNTMYDKMTMKIKSPYMSINIDGDDESEEDNPVYAIMKKMLKGMQGKVFTLKMNKQGEILEVDGFEEMITGVITEIADELGDVNEQMLNAANKQMSQAYGKEALKGSFEMLFKVYNDKPVSVNDKWTQSIPLQTGMEGEYDVEYTLKEKTNNEIKIRAEGKLKTADKDAYVQMNGMDAKYLLDGEYTGDYTLDAESGWIKTATLNFEAGGTVEIKANEQIPDGMSIPMNLKGKTTINN